MSVALRPRHVPFLAATLITAIAGAARPGDAAPDFAGEVYPALEERHCRTCHSASGVASETRLHFPESGASREAIEAFGIGLAVLVDASNIPQSPLLLKPTNRIPHTGGPLIAPGSEAERALAEWAEHLSTLPVDRMQEAAAARGHHDEPIRRLTHAQYDNTVRDILGDRTRPSRRFPAEDFVHGFTNQAASQSVTPALAEAYALAAEKLARNAFRYGDENGIVPCEPNGPQDRECAAEFVSAFGSHAFRRPLEAEEKDLHTQLLLRWAAEANNFLEGAAATVEAMLQSPHFLFLAPEGADSPFKQFETASRLSYALWDAPPDAELRAAAAAGVLGTHEQVMAHARRLVADGRARPAMDKFFAEWMRFDRLLTSVKDRNRFRDYGPEVARSMTEESLRLFGHLVWNDLDFREFFTADYTFVDDFLTKVYGMAEPSVPFGKTAYPAGSGRAGILGHGTFLAQTGKPVNTSPTERGLFVREHFLCQAIPPPPPGVDASLPPLKVGARPMTIRETLQQLHAADQVCASCHKLVDPIGFGFEHFDSVGGYRETEPVRVEPTPQQERQGIEAATHDLPIDSSGFIAGIEGSGFASPRGAGGVLARSPGCHKCIAKQLFRYVFGRSETTLDTPTIERAYNRFRDSGFVFRELLLELVVSEEYLGVDWEA